ncbi:TadE family protein [Streptomyces sp. CB02959]|uniref:TadE family protein n=1 Tax=unclassified Streptomyces TaxID=2593676 RepID=UPI0021534108|nr:TadE family protein [Streptomyces sp. CB02959]
MRRPAGPGRAPGDRDRGQVSVEFLGLLPLILVVLALLWQCALTGYTYALAAHAADRGARAATATEDGGAGACRTAAAHQLPRAWQGGATTACTTGTGLWTATVRIKVPVLFPGAGDLPWTVTGTAGAAKEARDR